MKKKFNGFNCIQKANPTRHCSDRKCAFTLAETMVVVVVLGIIATLTIPALVNKNKESVAKTKVRKAMAAYESALNKMIIENDLKSDTALNEWAGATANCGNPSNYFKKVQGDGCTFKTSDGIWWDISNIERPLIAFKDTDLTVTKANDPADKTAFVLVGRFGNDGSLRVDDLAYETANSVKDANNYESKTQVEKLYSLLGMKSTSAGGGNVSCDESSPFCQCQMAGEEECTVNGLRYKKVTIEATDAAKCKTWNANWTECTEWDNPISSTEAGDIWITDTISSFNDADARSNENCLQSRDESWCKVAGDYWTLARRSCGENARLATAGELKALNNIGQLDVARYWAEERTSDRNALTFYPPQGLVDEFETADSLYGDYIKAICVGN